MTTPTKTDSRKKTVACLNVVERIADNVNEGRWTDDQGMARLAELARISPAAPDFFERIEALDKGTPPTAGDMQHSTI